MKAQRSVVKGLEGTEKATTASILKGDSLVDTSRSDFPATSDGITISISLFVALVAHIGCYFNLSHSVTIVCEQQQIFVSIVE